MAGPVGYGSADLKNALHEIADECDRIVNAMDFGFLWNRRRKVLSIGCDVETGLSDPSVYDLLASESRMASFVAIAKGEIPQESLVSSREKPDALPRQSRTRFMDRHDVRVSDAAALDEALS